MTQSAEHLCDSADIQEKGRGVRFRLAIGDRRLPGFAIRYEGTVYAYLNQCAHQSVELDWQQGEFFDSDRRFLICATHGALYHPDSGACAHGQCAGRGLVQLKTEETAGEIRLINQNGIHLDKGTPDGDRQ